MAAPAERGEGNQRAMRAALKRAGIRPDEVDYINAHGTSTPLNDRYETMAIRDVFGEHADRLAVSSTKSMTGHAMGAAGAIEAFVCVKVIATGCIPPTINYQPSRPGADAGLRAERGARRGRASRLSNSMGLGGHNSTVILRRWDE
jgi:3-oxoacyl-(acyl-carrier-protein) synthase